MVIDECLGGKSNENNIELQILKLLKEEKTGDFCTALPLIIHVHLFCGFVSLFIFGTE